MTVHKLNLELSKSEVDINEPIYLRQGDKSSHSISAEITEFSQPADISNYTATFNTTKPDGNLVSYAAAISGNTITCQLTGVEAEVPGTMYGYFSLADSSGNEINSTNSFKIVVLKAANANISSRPYIQSVEELIHTLKQNVDQFQAGASDQIATIQASLRSLQKQVDTSAQTAADNAIAKLQNEINGVEKSLQDQIKAATDDAAKQAIKDLQSQLDALVQSATTAKDNAINKINALDSQAANTLKTINQAKTDSDNALKALQDNKSSGEDTLKAIAKIQGNAQQSLDELTTKVTTSTTAANDYVKQTKSSAEKAIALIDDINKNKQASLDTYNQSLTDNLNSAKDKLTAALNKVAVDGKTAIDNFDTAGNKAIQKIQSDFNDLKKQNASLDLSKFATTDELATKADKTDVATELGNYYDKTTTDSKLAAKANTADVATELGNYYDKTTTDSKLAAKANTADVATELGNYYDKATTDSKLAAKANTADVYTKTELDPKLAEAGKVKTVSLNGGNKVAPDSGGNIDLAVPQPDLTGYAKTADVNGQFTTVNNQIKELQSRQSAFTPITQAAYNNLTDTQKTNGMYAIIG